MDATTRSAFLALWSEASSGSRTNYQKSDWLELERHLEDDDADGAAEVAVRLRGQGQVADQAAWDVLASQLGI